MVPLQTLFSDFNSLNMLSIWYFYHNNLILYWIRVIEYMDNIPTKYYSQDIIIQRVTVEKVRVYCIQTLSIEEITHSISH